jgi:hypothetical protein
VLTYLRTGAGIIVGLLATLFALDVPYTMATEYGSMRGLNITAAVVAAPFIWLGVWLVVRRPLVGLTAGVALSLTAMAVGAVLGQRAHDRNRDTAASACSAAERTALRELGTVPLDGEYGSGDADGTCSGPLGDRTLEQATARLTAQRWTLIRDGVYARDGQTLLVEVTDEGDKGKDITLRFPR